ncbi:hypothetical protein SMMN14_05164 [Sphaerulina musiva]
MRLVALCLSWIIAVTAFELLGEAPRTDRLSFVKPSKNDATHFGVGSKVDVVWITPYSNTNLEIWQGPRADGSFAMESLLKNASNSTTTFTWKAKPLDNLHFAEAFHFRLQKGDGDVFCDGCIASSVEIRVSNIVNTESSVVADGKSGNDGLGSQDKLMIGLSIGIASAVIAGFITLMCCTQKRKSSNQRGQKRPPTPQSMQHFLQRAFGDNRRERRGKQLP